MSQRISVGDFLFDVDDDSEIKVTCPELDSKRKLTTQAGQGDDDGTLTRGGREPRSVKLVFEWPDREDLHEIMGPKLEELDAAAPVTKGQKPLSFGYERNGLDLAKLKRISIVEVEETKGPTFDEGTGVAKYELSLKSASPAKKGTGSTANAAGSDVAAWKDPNTLTAKVSPGYAPSQTTAKGGKPEVKP